MEYYIVDVFSDVAFQGNPVAVFFVDQELSNDEMQSIASWTNLSETTFIEHYDKEQSSYKVRIFTPNQELKFAGHPTIGSAAAVKSYFNCNSNTLTQQCGIGDIELNTCSSEISFLSPKVKYQNVDSCFLPEITKTLGIDGIMVASAIIDVGPIWLAVIVESGSAVSSIIPNISQISDLSSKMEITGITIAGAMPNIDGYKVRTFAPIVGVPEDPVCGSGNIAIAKVLYTESINKDPYVAYQGQEIGRNGKVFISYDGDDVVLGGRTCITAKGRVGDASNHDFICKDL